MLYSNVDISMSVLLINAVHLLSAAPQAKGGDMERYEGRDVS